MRYLIILLIALALLPLSGGQATTVADYCLRPLDSELLVLINQHRVANGRVPLQADQRAGAAAEHHSLDMATHSYFSHTLSDGTTWSQNMTNHGYTATGRAENIALGYTTAQSVFNAWKASSGHNTNMLRSDFRAIGLSMIAVGTGNEWYWTNTFGTVLMEPARSCGGPTSTPSPTRTPTLVPTATNTPTPTPTPDPSVPTNTPLPTNTPTMTPSPVPPTATATLTPIATPKPCRGNGRRACDG
jgi:cell division septation protein DedD